MPLPRFIVAIGSTAAFTLALTLAGCNQKGSNGDSGAAGSGGSAKRVAAGSYANLPEAPPPSRAKPTDEQIAAVKAVAADLDRRAKANEEAFFRKLMPDASPSAVTDMIGRVQGADLNATYAKHLVVSDATTARFNYHDPSHFQVDLKKTGDQWAVTRLWFCR